MEKTPFKSKIGTLIQETRQSKGMTQAQLAKELGTSQSAVNRIEKGDQNISLEMIARISDVLSQPIVSVNQSGKINFRIDGGHQLSGSIDVKTSKNAAVALLCASLLNQGKTTLRRVARIEEVNRIIEVLNSIGVKTRWMEHNDLEIIPPKRLQLGTMNIEAAKRTRSVIMFLGPLLHQYDEFELPFAGGCTLGTRTVEPHMSGLRHFGLSVEATTDFYKASVADTSPTHPIVLTERGDTVTENILMAAALNDGVTVIHNASMNYMVQDLCLFLQKLGVKIEGMGTTSLKVTGLHSIDKDVEYYPSEDPIEAMSLIAAGIVTKSEITVKRVPLEFMEIELAILSEMGLQYDASEPYTARNGYTKLIDVHVMPSRLTAPKDKLHSMPFPAVNMDNLPLLGLVATIAHGRTLVHDWSYENRAIYFTELSKLNASIEMVDPHRVYISGPTRWKAADIVTPPALRPSVVILLAMLAAPGTSVLRDVYSINRGYEDLAERLNSLGARITVQRDLVE